VLNHEKVFDLAKKDSLFLGYIKSSDQKFPRWTWDTLEKGIWASSYAGWVLGYYGVEEYKRKVTLWRKL